MRCPECEQRNSVAARKCQFCGSKFAKKSKSLPVKAIAAVLGVCLLGFVVFSVVPKLTQPNQDLKKIASSITSGPESAEQAQKLKNELDQAILAFLKKNGGLSSGDLLTTLQAQLPTSIFEVLVFDLPRGIKLVEVDCVLQPADFLIIDSDGGPKVTQLFGLDVFDEGRLIKTGSDPYLVLIGHTNVDMKKKPNLKAVALLPNGNSVDQSNKLIPPIRGEGSITFDKNNRDIVLERHLISTAKGEELFEGVLPFEDKQFKTVLKWTNGKYDAEHNLGSSRFSALYAVASALTAPGEAEDFKAYLDQPARDFIKSIADNPVSDPPGFNIAKMEENKASSVGNNRRSRRRARRAPSSRSEATYALTSGKRTFEVVLSGSDSQRWTASNIEESTPESTGGQMAENSSEASGADESKIVVKAPEQEKVVVAPPKAVEPPKKVVEPPKKAEKPAQEKPKPKEKAPVKVAQKPTQVPERKTESAPASAAGKSVITSRGVTLRTGPGTGSKKLFNVGKGTPVKVIGKENGWYKVVVNGKQGYVWSGLVDYKKADGYTTAVVRKTKPVQDSNRKVVSSTKPGEKVVVVGGLKNNRYKVRTANGKIGYVEKDAVDVAVEEPAFVP